MTQKVKLFFLGLSLCFLNCGKDGELVTLPETPEVRAGCSTDSLLENFTDPDGNDIYIYEDGKVFLNNDGECEFELQYFEPGFVAQNYITNTSGIFLKDGSELVPTKNSVIEDFEKSDFVDLFVSDPSSPNLFWTGFTLQSPQAKTVSEYVALSKCILEGTCDFLDNTIKLVQDPTNSSNEVVEFSSVAPSADMVTSKCSITSGMNYFNKDADVWYEADYYIKSGMPYSIVDFETSYFDGSPGPRVVIRNSKLELENQFGAKLRFTPDTAPELPLEEWFTVKVHLKFNNTDQGILELWQDGVQIISTSGINLPTANALQNILEVGISASQEDTVVLMDNMRISDTAF